MVDHERDRKVLEESSELRNHQDLIKISLGFIEGALSQGRRGKEKLKPGLSRVKRENWMEEKKELVGER